MIPALFPPPTRQVSPPQMAANHWKLPCDKGSLNGEQSKSDLWIAPSLSLTSKTHQSDWKLGRGEPNKSNRYLNWQMWPWFWPLQNTKRNVVHRISEQKRCKFQEMLLDCVSWGNAVLKAVLFPVIFDAPRVAAVLIRRLTRMTFHWAAPGAASQRSSGLRLKCRFIWPKTGPDSDRRVLILQ